MYRFVATNLKHLGDRSSEVCAKVQAQQSQVKWLSACLPKTCSYALLQLTKKATLIHHHLSIVLFEYKYFETFTITATGPRDVERASKGMQQHHTLCKLFAKSWK